jgi:hypothetical protein
LPAGAKPNLKVQLSSPIEEGILNTLYDPLHANPEDSPEGSIVVFRGVEPTVATLTVTARDADVPLGSSPPHEVAPLCVLDPMDIKDKYVSELPMAIVAEDETGSTPAQASAVQVEKSGEASDAASASVVVALQPICTVTLRITYKPSPKDQREELYELLNKTSQRKATALDNLRTISMRTASARSGRGGSTAPSSDAAAAKPSVKPGFLNKARTRDSRWKRFYDRALGPESMARRGAFFALAAKDFFIFFGAVTFFHFKGQLLAIPPPV